VSIVCRACKFCRRRAKTSANLLLLHWRTALCAIAAVPLLQWRLGPLARRASLSLSVWRATRARRPGPTLSGCTRRPLRRGPTMENRSNCCKRDDKSINQWAPHPGWLHARSGSCAQPGRALTEPLMRARPAARPAPPCTGGCLKFHNMATRANRPPVPRLMICRPSASAGSGAQTGGRPGESGRRASASGELQMGPAQR